LPVWTYLPPLLISIYSRFAVSYSSLETARQPSRKGGCCALTDEGVNAVSNVPTSKNRKNTAVQSDLRDLPISSLPNAFGRPNRPVFKCKLIALVERDEPAIAQRGRLFLEPCGGFQPHHENLCQHCDHTFSEPAQHSTI